MVEIFYVIDQATPAFLFGQMAPPEAYLLQGVVAGVSVSSSYYQLTARLGFVCTLGSYFCGDDDQGTEDPATGN